MYLGKICQGVQEDFRREQGPRDRRWVGASAATAGVRLGSYFSVFLHAFLWDVLYKALWAQYIRTSTLLNMAS
jgi:hypothetical protein